LSADTASVVSRLSGSAQPVASPAEMALEAQVAATARDCAEESVVEAATNENGTDFQEPFRDAVRVAVWLEVNWPEMTVNRAELLPPGGTTVGAITTRTGLSLPTAMLTVPVGFETFTVQAEGWLGPVNVAGLHSSDWTLIAEGDRAIDVLTDDPFNVAVTMAD
jgi:hypothetical protein